LALRYESVFSFRGRDHFFLMAGMRVRCLCVNAFITGGRWKDYAIILDKRRRDLAVVGTRRIMTLGRRLFGSIRGAGGWGS
jgi:hypothetical protein